MNTQSIQRRTSVARKRIGQRGMSTVEYVVLLAFIVVGAVGTWQTIGGNVQGALEKAEEDTNLLNDVEASD